MNFYEVQRIERPIDCTVEVPGSKSVTNRALLLAALSEGTTVLEGALFSEDVYCFLNSLKSMGVSVTEDEAKKQIRVDGNGGRIPNPTGTIYVGSAGTAARFLTAWIGLSDVEYEITASGQMENRPMKELFEVLESLGAQITYLKTRDYLPVRIKGVHVGSQPVKVSLDISKSTQYLSALLMVAPLFEAGLRVRITSEKKSGSYVEITRKMMEDFGIEAAFDGECYTVAPGSCYQMPDVYQVEPDVSSACYFYAAAAITGGSVTVKNVRRDLMQGDIQFLDVLKEMGCFLSDKPAGLRVTGPVPGRLKAVSVDMNDFSDQALTLAAIAPYADGMVEIRNVEHIRGQECDRMRAISDNMRRMRITCEEGRDSLRIYPGEPEVAELETYNDHRVAMAFSILGLRAKDITIMNPECCAKTFPDFYKVLETLDETDW